MKDFVITHNEIEGFHYWKDAPQNLKYLSDTHRHIFVIECKWCVRHGDRDIEIITQQHQIENFVRDRYGIPALFGTMSCEMIAEDIVSFYPNCYECSVREDGFGGAVVVR